MSVITFYTTRDFAEMKDGIINGLKEVGYESDEITDSLVFDEFYSIKELDFLQLKDKIDSWFEEHLGFVMSGDLGFWNGKKKVNGFVLDSDMLLRLLRGYDDVEVYDKDGRLFISLYHHDGHHNIELQSLTENGYRYADSAYDEYGLLSASDIFGNEDFSDLPYLNEEWDALL